MNKVVRLPNGNFITRKIVESDPAAIARAKPEEIWTMNDGKSNSGKTNYTRQILIRDMETSHLINAMNVLYRKEYVRLRSVGTPGLDITEPDKNRNIDTINAVKKILRETRPEYRTMEAELSIRLGRESREPEQPQRPRRKITLQ